MTRSSQYPPRNIIVYTIPVPVIKNRTNILTQIILTYVAFEENTTTQTEHALNEKNDAYLSCFSISFIYVHFYFSFLPSIYINLSNVLLLNRSIVLASVDVAAKYLKVFDSKVKILQLSKIRPTIITKDLCYSLLALT